MTTQQQGWIDGALDVDPSEEVNFESGLPCYTKVKRSKSVKRSNVPLGKGKYKNVFDFEEGLPSVKAKVKIEKAAAVESNTREDFNQAPLRVHKGSQVESRLSTSGNSSDSSNQKEEAPIKVQPKLEAHVHSFKVAGTQVFTSSGKMNKDSHYHVVKIGSVSYQTNLAKEGVNHTHTIKIEGKSISSSGPEKSTKQPTKEKTQPSGVEKQAPKEGMTREQLQAARQARSKKYGIEILQSGSKLSFGAGRPSKLDQYADPVNLKFPVDTVERSRNARVRFKQFANNYKQTSSKKVIHERIVRAEINFGVKPDIDPNDPLDALLPSTLKKTIELGFVPEVLSWEAVRTGEIPELGVSGLPESLEKDVPPRFRYWKCETVEDSILVRNALVEEQLFTEETIMSVNGELRRAVIETVQKLFLPPSYDSEEPVEVPHIVKPIEKVSKLLEASSDERSTVLFDEEIVEAIGLETIIKRANRINGDYVICFHNEPELRKCIEGSAFRLKSRDDLIFITNAKISDERLIEWVQFERSTELVKFALNENRKIRFFKSEDEEEERTVFGIVLEPEEVDAQGDIISAQEIKQACYKFMEDFGNLGRQHQEIVNGKLKLLENYIAPINFKVENQHVKKGSWLMKERVIDEGLWKAAKAGNYTGFSIGGSGVRKPVE